MKTYKITTSTGYTNYLGCSLDPEVFFNQNIGFDYDKFNARMEKLPEWDKSSGVITEIELFWCDVEQKQVRKSLIF